MSSRQMKLLRSGLMFLVLFGMGAAFGYLLGRYLKGHFGKVDIPGFALALIVSLACFLVLLAHELGHLAGGAISGFSFRLLIVGPFRVERDEAGWHFKLNRSLAMAGGLAASVPTAAMAQNLEALRTGMLWYSAGGPAVSLLGGLALFPASALYVSQPYLAAALGVFGILSLIIGLMTCVPNDFGGFTSDGARIFGLLGRTKESERWCALSALTAISQVDRPRNWPEALVLRSTASGDCSPDFVSAAWLRHSYHLDRGELIEAGTWLETALRAIEFWPAAMRPLLHTSAAYFIARHQDNPALAREHLAQAKQGVFATPETLLLAEAAILQREGRFEEARETAQRGAALRRRPADPGLAIQDSFDDILRLAA
jgi:hypothetical protein